MKKLVPYACLALCACSVNPSVKYLAVETPQQADKRPKRFIDSFYQPKSELVIAYKRNDKQALILNVTYRRAQATDRRYIAIQSDPIWARTTLSFTKFENTDIPSAAAVAVADQRIDLMKNVAGIAKIAIATGAVNAGSVKCPESPAESDCIWSLPEKTEREGLQDRESVENSVITVGPVPFTAVRASDAFPAGTVSPTTHGYYYAACREVTVRYSTDDTHRQVWKGVVADPNWLEYVAFPRKGSIKLHEQCGASTTADADPTKTGDAVALAAFTEIMALREELKKAKKE